MKTTHLQSKNVSRVNKNSPVFKFGDAWFSLEFIVLLFPAAEMKRSGNTEQIRKCWTPRPMNSMQLHPCVLQLQAHRWGVGATKCHNGQASDNNCPSVLLLPSPTCLKLASNAE